MSSSNINNLSNNKNNEFEKIALLEKQQQQSEQNKEEMIEMIDLNNTKKQQQLNNKLKLNKKLKTANLLNEFTNNPALDFEYKKSYLAITRVILTSYIFYLIIYSICWIIYYSIDNTFYLNNNNNQLNENEYVFERPSNLIIYLYSVYLAILLLIFIFLMIFEFKETHYKQLKNDIKQRILETKVDKLLAEKNFKEAIAHYMQSNAKIEQLNKKLDLDHSHYLSRIRRVYSRFSQKFAIFILIYIFIINLLAFKYKPNALTFIGHTIWYIEIILILYCMYPFNIYLKLSFALIFSIVYESISLNEQFKHFNQESNIIFIFTKILFNFILHLIGIYLYAYLEILKRNTFLNVCNMNLTHINAEYNKNITETMIKSIMPPLFTHIFGKPEEFKKSVLTVYKMRPLYVYPIDNISILFADIVGFTKMSSNKTAQELVFLLNDLYGRFDRLCDEVGCEKISTLGDCYYCVSGCLNCREDHAKCCVEMGLSMIKEIESFNSDNNVEVNMRVGVHTGKALCGFIGGKRFRFDVWSSDVTFANKMESSGRAGEVHISQSTFNQLKDEYNTEKDENKINGECTYFVIADEKRKVKTPTVADTLQQEIQKQQQQKEKDEVEYLQSQKPQEPPTDTVVTLQSNVERKVSENLQNEASAIKNIEFFRPDFNLITMCFNYKHERKYYQFLMGYNYFQRDRQYKVTGEKYKISTKKWSNPRNIFFISLLLSFFINILSIFSYISVYLTYQHTNLHVLSLILTFCLLISLQLALILVYFIKYTTFFKLNKYLTSIFSTQSPLNQTKTTLKVPNSNNNNNNNHQNAINNHTNRYKLSSTSTTTTGTNTTSTYNKSSKRNSLVKYILVHLISILYLVLSPIIIFLFSFILNQNLNNDLFLLYSSLTYLFTIIQFCTFIQLNNLFKTFLMSLYTALYCVFAIIGVDFTSKNNYDNHNNNNFTNTNQTVFIKAILYDSINSTFIETVEAIDYYKTYFVSNINNNSTNYSVIIDMLLLLLLVYLINRQFELVQRVCFQCDQDAYIQINSSKDQKDLANWLIDVVIPAHVVEHVKAKKQYSHNYDCVGVLFVSLCNYAEFYEETFQGGRELIRVLNEISIDFDQLLDDPRYRNIEKIKSIGSTFMIASGLNVVDNEESFKNDNAEKKSQHLYDLVDFALKLWEKLESFNHDAMSVCHFKFQMRMGLNFGPVTSGVIGKDRLLYDIWGDTVNVASRMDSTGLEGVLQTPEAAAGFLSDRYLFHYRDVIKVKGKDPMRTYVLKPSENQGTNHSVGLLPN
jgi:class 3 adenylate cyclase